MQNPDNLLLTLAERIRNLRVGFNLSQEELAIKMYKDKQFIQRIESGKYNPHFITIAAIADALNVPLSILVNIKTTNQKTLYCSNHTCRKFNQHSHYFNNGGAIVSC